MYMNAIERYRTELKFWRWDGRIMEPGRYVWNETTSDWDRIKF